MATYLSAIRLPNNAEKTEGAEIVFERKDEDGRTYLVYGAKCHESWEQWGAHLEVLSENMPAIESWRRGRMGVKLGK